MAMVDFAVEWLAGLFGSNIKRAVRRTQTTHWNDEPWMQGAIVDGVARRARARAAS